MARKAVLNFICLVPYLPSVMVQNTEVCSFESSSICGYRQDKSDTQGFNWIWHYGSTNSPRTGPSADHTYGSNFGHYMYIEASPRNPNDTARIISPEITAAPGPHCLTFYVHMYGGRKIGTLNVYVFTTGQLHSKGSPVWSRSSSWGNKWRMVRKTVHLSGHWQIIFEAIRDRSYRGDIAIDDVSVLQGPCRNIGSSMETSVLPKMSHLTVVSTINPHVTTAPANAGTYITEGINSAVATIQKEVTPTIFSDQSKTSALSSRNGPAITNEATKTATFQTETTYTTVLFTEQTTPEVSSKKENIISNSPFTAITETASAKTTSSGKETSSTSDHQTKPSVPEVLIALPDMKQSSTKSFRSSFTTNMQPVEHREKNIRTLEEDNNSLGAGKIAIIVVGVLLLIGAAVGIAIFIVKRRITLKKNRKEGNQASAQNPYYGVNEATPQEHIGLGHLNDANITQNACSENYYSDIRSRQIESDYNYVTIDVDKHKVNIYDHLGTMHTMRPMGEGAGNEYGTTINCTPRKTTDNETGYDVNKAGVGATDTYDHIKNASKLSTVSQDDAYDTTKCFQSDNGIYDTTGSQKTTPLYSDTYGHLETENPNKQM